MQSAEHDLARAVIKFLSDRGYLTSPLDVVDLMIELQNAIGSTNTHAAKQEDLSLASKGRSDVQEMAPVAETQELRPAVSRKQSIHRDYLICLEDGQRVVLLRRYLKSRYNMTPDQYRIKWGLPPDYPMVAPGFAERKSLFAKQIGFGRSHRPEFKEHYEEVKRQLNVGSKKQAKKATEQASQEESAPAARRNKSDAS